MMLITVPLAFLKWLITVGLFILLITVAIMFLFRKVILPIIAAKDTKTVPKYIMILLMSLLPVGLTMLGLELFQDDLPIYKEADLSVRFYAKVEKAIFFYTSLGASLFASLLVGIRSSRSLKTYR